MKPKLPTLIMDLLVCMEPWELTKTVTVMLTGFFRTLFGNTRVDWVYWLYQGTSIDSAYFRSDYLALSLNACMPH